MGEWGLRRGQTCFPVFGNAGEERDGSISDSRMFCADEWGFITRTKYDILTGAITQRIDDVDTSIETEAPMLQIS